MMEMLVTLLNDTKFPEWIKLTEDTMFDTGLERHTRLSSMELLLKRTGHDTGVPSHQ